jgi:Mrp family chromosome partitioning ATPase
MISNALITGGAFSQTIDQRQVYAQTQKSKSDNNFSSNLLSLSYSLFLFLNQITPLGAIDRLQEAVAHTAFHNAGERFDPPRCHPNTRVAVLDKIEKWALRMDPDTSDTSILWLSGAAGAGKSAIAQNLAEHFHSKGLLIASFFFGRSDSTRNHARSLVSTMVYQLYSLLPPFVTNLKNVRLLTHSGN